jgi:penicillin amidase
MGFVPFEQNPHLKNPPCGYIVTANNLSTIKPVGPIELIEGYWQPSDRAARIEELIESKERWSVDELKVMQFDDLCCTAPPIVERIVEAVRGSNAELSEPEQQALDALAAWDLKHDTASKGACVFHFACDSILHHMLIDEMGEDLFANYTPLGDQWNSFKYTMQEEALPFWDDVSTPERETRQDIVLRAFRETVAELSRRMGGVDQWSWGAIHTMEFKHPFGYLPLLGRIFNVGPFPSTGAGDVINNMLYAGGGNYEVVAGPSTRRLIDYGDIEHSLTVLPTGNSGNFMSPHYGDQAHLFMSGQYREARFTRSQIDSHKKHEMRFLPAQ